MPNTLKPASVTAYNGAMVRREAPVSAMGTPPNAMSPSPVPSNANSRFAVCPSPASAGASPWNNNPGTTATAAGTTLNERDESSSASVDAGTGDSGLWETPCGVSGAGMPMGTSAALAVDAGTSSSDDGLAASPSGCAGVTSDDEASAPTGSPADTNGPGDAARHSGAGSGDCIPRSGIGREASGILGRRGVPTVARPGRSLGISEPPNWGLRA